MGIRDKKTDERGAAEITGALMLIVVIIAAVAVIFVTLISQPPPETIPAVSLDITNQSRIVVISHECGDPLLLSEMGIQVDGIHVSSDDWACTGCADDFSLGDIIRIDSSAFLGPGQYPNRVNVIQKKAGADHRILTTRYLVSMYVEQPLHTPPLISVPSPEADFTGTPINGNSPLTVRFTDHSKNTPTSWSWNFGDGGTSTDQDPEHEYSSPGIYSVTLYVSNDGGSDIITRVNYITVTLSPPEADFIGVPTSGTVPLRVDFTDRSTGIPAEWNWNFGDIMTGNTSILQNPTHTYTRAGTYTVSLAVWNVAGTDALTRTNYITVSAIRPVASFTGSPRSGTEPLTVNFTDTSQNDPTSWQWDFGDGSTSTLQNPAHRYASEGTYRVRLTTTNSAGSDTVSVNNYITVTPFTADFSYSKSWILIWCIVDFTDTTTGTPPPNSWSWDFGDGSTSTVQNPTHTYWLSDNYDVTLRVSNANGASDTVTININH